MGDVDILGRFLVTANSCFGTSYRNPSAECQRVNCKANQHSAQSQCLKEWNDFFIVCPHLHKIQFVNVAIAIEIKQCLIVWITRRTAVCNAVPNDIRRIDITIAIEVTKQRKEFIVRSVAKDNVSQQCNRRSGTRNLCVVYC